MTVAIDIAARAAWGEIARQNGENTSGYAGTYAGRPNYVEGFIDPVALARAVLMAVRGVGGRGIEVNYWSERVADAILSEEDK